MNKYKISVVVPTYNTGKDIYNLFNSLKNQTIGFDDIEVIFVDDNSSDKTTLDILEELNNLDNVSVFYFDDNSGFPGRGRNLGLSKAQGEYVIFADHDDSYNLDAFEKMYDEASLNDASVVLTNYYNVFGDKKVSVKTDFKGENIVIEDIKQDLRLFSLGPSIWTKLLKRDFLISNNIQFLEGMLAEDLELFIHSILLSKKTVYLDDFCSYNYSIRDSDEDKSTIHLRNKVIFTKMIEGYFKTYELLEKLNNPEYFDLVFKKHFVYFLTSLVKSEIPDEDKKDLLIKINPILKKELAISSNLDERRYNKLTKYLAEDNYEKAVKEIKNIKRKNKIKSILGRKS